MTGNSVLDRLDEQQFLKNYQQGEYPGFALTADINLFTIIKGELRILLVKRGGYPYKGCFALPGGFVNPDETSEQAARRELGEETGLSLKPKHFEQLQTYTNPDRDPRMRVISTAYIAFLPNPDVPKAGDDAVETRFVPVSHVLDGTVQVAFDHLTIIGDALERVRAKFEYAPVATSFLPPTFTLADLRRVYEIVWGEELHPSNFRRKVLGTPGFLTVTKSKQLSSTGGRTAQHYTKGNASMLHPALLRKGK